MKSPILSSLCLFLFAACAAACTPVVAQAPTITPTDCGCSIYGPEGEATNDEALPAEAEVTPSPLPLTAYQNQWDVHFNDEYGFFFDYPAVYEAGKFGFCQVREQASANPSDGDLFTLNLGSRTVLTLSDPRGKSLEAILQDYQAAPERESVQFGPPQERTVAGLPALSLPTQDNAHEVTFWVKDDRLYSVETGSPSACDVAEIDLREQDAYRRMLDSFGY